MIKIFLGYKPTNEAGGGANNFLRSLYVELRQSRRFKIVEALDDAEIVFLNQLNAGEGNIKYRLDEIFKAKERVEKLGGRQRIVVRAVNLRRHSYGLGGRAWWSSLQDDLTTLKLVNLADFVIFQSQYQRGFFTEHGFISPCSRVIHNGASPIFLKIPKRELTDGQRIRLVSATASPRKTKRHDIIYKFAECPDVEVLHFGRWPDKLPSGRVKLMGICTHQEMRDVYASAHGFIHPATKDPCPNAVIEALASGLPVFYGNEAGSSAELVSEYGIKISNANTTDDIFKFRLRYQTMTDKLELNRSSYGVARSAIEYMNIFDCIW